MWLKAAVVNTRNKTLSFALLHFSVAWGVGFALSGDLFVGGLLAIIEPCCNSVAYYFFEKRWREGGTTAWVAA
nr:DUF2061 domain-containing protein [Neptuniibacter halophilus]